MVHPDTSFVFDLKKDSVSNIEHFVDFICDQLLINDTYSGNILVSLMEFFNLAKEIPLKGKMNISYYTDHQKIVITIQPIDNQINTILNSEIKVEDTKNSSIQKSLYLLKALVDKIDIMDGNALNLEFDISAIHNRVYSHRQNALTSYFEQARIKLHKSNDSF